MRVSSYRLSRFTGDRFDVIPPSFQIIVLKNVHFTFVIPPLLRLFLTVDFDCTIFDVHQDVFFNGDELDSENYNLPKVFHLNNVGCWVQEEAVMWYDCVNVCWIPPVLYSSTVSMESESEVFIDDKNKLHIMQYANKFPTPQL